MKWRKGWAILSEGESPRCLPWELWAFDIYNLRREALRCLGAGERIVPVEYRFPKAKERK